jgi:hypothetical protein
MWETTALHVPLSKVGKKVKNRGLPHLAKNERDMGHPTILGRDKERVTHAFWNAPQVKIEGCLGADE